ncbi:sugar phosphate isomerase/epimerase [Dysgonomonas sp. Marseille-P4361]|uniref:sugar phosphate isomerase/epimerase family protein n=1 Tax=Dysgonomonas sp. Marseille-P4361 TaxID=2161820 RepID=UPI000D54DA34|nr:sugar phosphate isomerase/epimerase family protein [Dysgonomonas sp. Marseille-P4361]
MRTWIFKTLAIVCVHIFFLNITVQAQTTKEGYKDDGELFKVAMAGYTFVNFDLDETLKMMQEVEVNYLCIKDFHLPLNSTDEQIAEFHKKLAAANVEGYAVGPIYMNSKEEVDRAFEYAKRVGVTLIVGVPAHEVLPYVNEKVKEYNFRYAIHLHGPDIKLYPHATDIYNHIKDLDPRMGICLDIGHNKRAGHDPIADLKKYKDRIFDIHMKNTTAASKEGRSSEIGRGIVDIPAFVRMLREVKYSGACSLEYEKNMKDPRSGIGQSIGYFRGVIDATK